jgi:AraC-like DNA-binding protein
MAALGGGASLTQAAHQAGVAGSAHFSARFLSKFGLQPSALMAFKPEIRAEPEPKLSEALVGISPAPLPFSSRPSVRRSLKDGE